jgi:radical SAM protein with 4Fe4S-binding SPASM domain
MPMEIYCKAVEQVVEAKCHSIMLSAFGEPLLDPYIVQRVEFASKFKTIRNIGFSTNGSLLTSGMYRRLAESGLKSMSISIDGFQKETYEKVRVGLSFDSLQENIVAMLETHDTMGHPISLSVSSFTEENPKNLETSFLHRRLLESGIKPGLKWRVDNWGGLISSLDTDLYLMHPRKRHGPCALLYDSSVLILPDGRITPCHCRDLEGDIYIGNVMEQSASQIWNGESLRTFRQEQWEGTFRPPCEKCSAYIPLRSWFTRSMARWILAYDRRNPFEYRNVMNNATLKNDNNLRANCEL